MNVKPLNVRTNTPTDQLLVLLAHKLAGDNADIVVSKLSVRDNNGAEITSVTVNASDWSNHTINKQVTMPADANVASLALVNSSGVDLYTYTLPSPVSLKANDKLNVTWTIGVSPGTNVIDVYNILEAIEGRNVDIVIAKMAFIYTGATMGTYNVTSKSVDETNKVVSLTCTFTPASSWSFDTIALLNGAGSRIVGLSGSGSVNSDVETTITVNLQLTK